MFHHRIIDLPGLINFFLCLSLFLFLRLLSNHSVEHASRQCRIHRRMVAAIFVRLFFSAQSGSGSGGCCGSGGGASVTVVGRLITFERIRRLVRHRSVSTVRHSTARNRCECPLFRRAAQTRIVAKVSAHVRLLLLLYFAQFMPTKGNTRTTLRKVIREITSARIFPLLFFRRFLWDIGNWHILSFPVCPIDRNLFGTKQTVDTCLRSCLQTRSPS